MAGQVYWGLNTYRSNPEIIGDPTILLLGDSWFWYPANNLASELAAQLDGEHALIRWLHAETQATGVRRTPFHLEAKVDQRLAGMAVTLKLCY